METLSNLFRTSYRSGLLSMTTLIILGFSIHNLSAGQVAWAVDMKGYGNWTVCYDYVSDNPSGELHEAPLALACKPNVNVSLGQGGYAVLTALLLVLAPEYPAHLYDVDIMGPLNDTVYCAQIGQSLMVVVTDPTGNSCMSTVFVEDKLKPVLTCSPDVIPCNVDIATLDFELYLDGVTDNCDPDPDLYYSYVILNLPCNANGYTQQINVTWTATDASGNSTTCVDILYLEKPSLGEIVFPPDVTIDCLNADIDPSNTGEPTFNGEPIGYTCQLVVFYTDQVVPMCNGSQKIIRLWTVMDWCNSGQITDVQEILIIDDVPPVITCPLNITINTNPGVCTAKYTLPNPPVTDACSDDSMIDIDIFVSTVPGIFSPGMMINLNLGTSLITIRATDACGNTSQCHYNVTVKDLTPPIPICHSLTIGLGPDGMAILIANLLDFPIIENCGILSKQIWRMDNACNAPEDLIPGPDVKFCCADVGDTIMVAFKVTDLSGNMNTCMFQVIVKDQLPPVAECKDITVSISNQGSLVITPDQIDDGSTDNCLIVDTTVTPNTFECEDIGVNVVVLTVTDQSGNTATCTATVTITDTVPPVAVCQNVTVTLNNDGDAVIITSQINNGSSDNCAIDTMFLDQYEFDCDDEGVNIVQLTVVDFAGNTATCTATVTVLTSPPVALCQNITVSLDDAGTVTISADQINNGSFDDCGIDTITVNPSTFDCDDIGTNIVTLTVTDISGNTSTCTAVVTVEDNTPPIALCQDITVMLDENGNAVITADQI
ncbi:MAG: HYR domain-containing protein, partial [Saprospiraceae bacterium]